MRFFGFPRNLKLGLKRKKKPQSALVPRIGPIRPPSIKRGPTLSSKWDSIALVEQSGKTVCQKILKPLSLSLRHSRCPLLCCKTKPQTKFLSLGFSPNFLNKQAVKPPTVSHLKTLGLHKWIQFTNNTKTTQS